MQDHQNDEFVTFFENWKKYFRILKNFNIFYIHVQKPRKNLKKKLEKLKTKIVPSKMDIFETKTRFLIVKRKGI